MIQKLKSIIKKKLNFISSDSSVNHNEISSHQQLCENYKEIFKASGYSVEVIKGDKIRIKGNGLTVIGNSDNTLWTAEDVLCKNDYEFNSSLNYIMIDIGLNIGLTSLLMARKKNILKIYGYEPFIPTFEQARINLKNNPQLAKKMRIYPFGLGENDRKVQINYNSKLPGAMSSVENKFPECNQIETIIIKKSSTIISEVMDGQIEDIFLKIDCEGAEFEIIRDLDKSGILNKIRLIILEWHEKNPGELIKILKSNNFIVIPSERIKGKLGYLRAVNINSKNSSN